MVARWVHPAPCPHPAGKAAVDARRCADVAQDGADSLVERRVVVVVDLPPAEPLLDLSCSPWRCDTGALEGQQDRQAPAQEMVPAGSTDRADHLPVGTRFVGTPRVGFGTSDYGRDYRVGYGIGVLDRESLNFELGVDAQRRENAMFRRPGEGGVDKQILGRATLGW